MRLKVLTMCVLVLSLMLAGCGSAQPSSGEVAEVMKRISTGMEAQRVEFWTPADITILFGDPIASGEVLQVRLSSLQVQRQQPPGAPAVRLVGQMHITNHVDSTVTLMNYSTEFLSSEGEVLLVEPDETRPLIEKVEPGDEVTVEFEALVPTVGDDVQEIAPDSDIMELAMEINYALGETQAKESLSFPMVFETE